MNTPAVDIPHQNNLLRPLLRAVILIVLTALLTTAIAVVMGENILGADFHTFWLAGRALLLEGRNPYSEQVTLESQYAIYGRAAYPEEDQVAFAYPPYSLLALIPEILLPYPWAYALWISSNLVGMLSLLVFLFRREARILIPTAILFFPVLFCLVMGNFSLLIASILIFLFGWVINKENPSKAALILGAAALAWASAKPQFIWLFTLFILLIAFRRKLWIFLSAYAGTLVMLFGISFAVLPDWVWQWTARVQEYAVYVNSTFTLHDFLRSLIGDPAALILTGITFGISVLITARLFFFWWNGRTGWLPIAAWIGMITYLFHPHPISYEQMAFLAPFFVWTGSQNPLKSRAVLFFWFGSIFTSWMGFGLHSYSDFAEHVPTLFNAAWVGWLLVQNTPASHSK